MDFTTFNVLDKWKRNNDIKSKKRVKLCTLLSRVSLEGTQIKEVILLEKALTKSTILRG